MTKFNIQTADLKYIMSALRPAVLKTDYRPVHQFMKFDCACGKLAVYATDGYRIHSVTVSVDVIDGKDKFAFLLKPFTIPKTDSDFIPCELSKEEIMFNFGEQKITFKTKSSEEFLNVQEAMPTGDVVYRIGFNPKFIADAAKSLQKGIRAPLIMEFRDPLSPVMIYSESDKSDFRLVLPVRLPKEASE